MKAILKQLEKKIIEEYKDKKRNKDFIKEHYKHSLELINPIVSDGNSIINEYQYNIMMHLFNLASSIEYIPSIFIKQIASLSLFKTLEITGFSYEVQTSKRTEFLSHYYKIVSIIMNNKFIKESKKNIFEKIVSDKLNEKTAQWLINLFTQSNDNLDDGTKVLLKAITQTKFEFFDAFAQNFKKALYELISSNNNKNWMNKYVFKIIEKCLIKLKNIEKEFLIKLGEICHSIIDIFLKKKNLKIKKLYQISIRIMYIIYHRRNEKNSKIIKFFNLKTQPIFNMELSNEFKESIIQDFIDVNFYILKKKDSLIQFYQHFYSLIFTTKEYKQVELYTQCIENIFKYEMTFRENEVSHISFIRLLMKDFSSNNNLDQSNTAINLICRIINNCQEEMKIKILEEITFTNFSFFSNENNIFYLKSLLITIKNNVRNNKIGEYYIQYLELLFTHSLKGKCNFSDFLEFFKNIKLSPEKLFYLTLRFAIKYFIYLQDNNIFDKNLASNEIKNNVTTFLEILAIKSIEIETFEKEYIQEILNIFSYFIIFKLFAYPNLDFSSKLKLTNTNDNNRDFSIYLIIFANNIPELIFNKNTFLTSPVKIEVSPLLLTKLGNSKKLFPSEFTDFGEFSSLNIETQLYLVAIYYQFISKYFFIRIIFDNSNSEEWSSQLEIIDSKILIKNLKSTKLSIVNLMNLMTDNIFLYNQKNNEFLSKMFTTFFEKYFDVLKKSYNTQFKRELLSYELKLLLKLSCYFNSEIRGRALKMIKTYSKYFPFLLNEYEIFEYYVNILGILIEQSLKHYDYFITEIPQNNLILELPSEKKTINQTYFNLYKVFEKGLQKSHMINNNNIAYNMSNYLNQYTINPSLQRDSMNYSVNLLQKIYNNIKKIEIPPTLKTSAYLNPEKFRNYLKTHVKKNYDKYMSLSSINDIFSPSDYAKSTKLQLRNKYIGIVEGKINNLRNELNKDDNKCYYRFKYDISKNISRCLNDNIDTILLSQKITPILIELTAFIVYIKRDDFKITFNKNIIIDELINILTSIPLLLNNSYAMETATFCWEWILYFDREMIPIILSNISTCLNHSSIKLYFLPTMIKSKSEIFDLENNFEDSVNNAKEIYYNAKNKIVNEILFSSSDNFLNPNKNVELINEKLSEKAKNVHYGEFINGQIILLKFLKECMNEFCKCDMEKLKLIYDIIKEFVDLKIDKNLARHPLYVYLHFFVFNISMELIDIIKSRIPLFDNIKKELNQFRVLVYLYGLRYFQFEKMRRMIENKFHLKEITETLTNCIENLQNDAKTKELLQIEANTKNIKKSKFAKVDILVNKIKKSKSNKNDPNENSMIYDHFKELLIYLIDNEKGRLRYWNNQSSSHKSNIDFSEEKLKKIFNTAFTFSYKLGIKLIQRFPWIIKKYPEYVNQLGIDIYKEKKIFYNQPFALNLLVEYITKNNLNDLSNKDIMKHLIFWRFPSLNYALKFISLKYTKMVFLHKYCIHMLEHALTKAIIFYLPQLIQSLRTDTNYQVAKFIFHKCKVSSMIAHQFLWALEVEEVTAPKIKKRYLPKDYIDNFNSENICRILRLKILKDLNYVKRKFWFEENEIFSQVNEVSGYFLHPEGEYANLSLKMTKEEKTDFVRKELGKLQGKILPYIYLPTNPTYRLLNILPKSAITLQSEKKVPFIVSFEAVEYPGPDKEHFINMGVTNFIETELKNLNNNVLFPTMLTSAKNTKTENEIENTSYNRNDNEDITCSDLSFEEKNYENENIEPEQAEGIFIPSFQPRVLVSKNSIIHSNINEINNKIFQDTNENIVASNNINNQNFNFFSLSNSNPYNAMTDKKNLELNDNISELSDCTLSDLDFEENENFKNSKVNKKVSITKHQIEKNSPNQIYMPCIFKVGDDLRQDALALQVIQIFQEIFNENNLKLYTYPYQTISTISRKYKDLGGYIEVVKDTDSRDQIGKTYETNLYDYYICSFGQENSNKFRSARKNLIISLAAYGIISYILQIKDRHNGNILIDKDGHLIHIDFGFIFDISPGGNMKFEKAAFKLTKEMIQIMEGTESEAYATFVDLTVRAFLACRDYMNNLLDPVYLMFSSGLDCFRENSIKHFIERFKLDLNEEDAANYMRGLIKVAADNWRTKGYDLIQKIQNNISY